MTESVRLPVARLKRFTVAPCPAPASAAAPCCAPPCPTMLAKSVPCSNRRYRPPALTSINSAFKSNILPGRLKVHGTGGRFYNRTAICLGNAGTAFRRWLTLAFGRQLSSAWRASYARTPHQRFGRCAECKRRCQAYLGRNTIRYFISANDKDNGERVIRLKNNVSAVSDRLLMALPLTRQARNRMVGNWFQTLYRHYFKTVAQFGVQVIWKLPRLQNSAVRRYHALNAASEAMPPRDPTSSWPVLLCRRARSGIGANLTLRRCRLCPRAGKNRGGHGLGRKTSSVSRPERAPSIRFDLDANHIPDAAMTLAIVALAYEQKPALRNIPVRGASKNRPHRRDGDELRKLGASRRRSRRFTSPPKRWHPTPSSAVTTTTAWRCVSRWFRCWAYPSSSTIRNAP